MIDNFHGKSYDTSIEEYHTSDILDFYFLYGAELDWRYSLNDKILSS